MIYYFLIFFKNLVFNQLQINFRELGFGFFIFSFFLLLIFVGLRNNVGGDFSIYQEYYYMDLDKGRSFLLFDTLFDIFRNNKLPFNLLILSISLFSLYALYSYSLSYKNFFLVLLVSSHLIITILFMGYIRQGIAFSFLLFALNIILNNRNNFLFYFYIILGSFFHLSLLIFLPMQILIDSKFNFKSFISFIFIALFSFLVCYLFINELKIFIYGYLIDKTLISSGSLIRIFINVFTGFIYLFFITNIQDTLRVKKLFILFFMASLLLFIAAFYFPVFADRMNYYLIPLQLHLAGNIHKLLKNPFFTIILRSLVVFVYFSMYLVWFKFGTYSHVWKNYDICLINCTNLELKSNIRN